MKQDLYKKLKTNTKIDFEYFLFPVPSFGEKIKFFFNKYIAVALNKRKISYLGSIFHYDNRFSPVLLQTYPKEIERLNRKINLENKKNVLDVGANIGQFAYTLNKLYPNLKIWSFEPNRTIFEYLRKNCISKNIVKLNHGLASKSGKRTLFYSPEASAEGSFYSENMHQNYERKKILKVNVSVKELSDKFLRENKMPKKFDLVKIDVEGAEIEALRALKNIEFEYLQIEVSTRRKGGELEDVKEIVKKIWNKKCNVLDYYLPEKNSPAANILIKLDK